MILDMAKLEHPKHEAFAYGLAKGLKQAKAYALAGYEPNASSASRLARSQKLQDRVAVLRLDMQQRIDTAMEVPSEENFQSLKEMGLSMEWCATQFKLIYEEAVHDRQFPAALTAVSNIQKMIEIEGAGKNEEALDDESKIKVSEAANLLDKLTEAIKAARGPNDIRDPADVATDITPNDDVSPAAIMQHFEDEEK